jgi:hypothetical protein
MVLSWTRWVRRPQTPLALRGSSLPLSEAVQHYGFLASPFSPAILYKWCLGPTAPAGPGQSPGPTRRVPLYAGWY